ncbi:MAG: hypothetical protein LBE74_02680 [Treponema sp.]|jgi:hypothetical protein|nr:hypothetical protein [Treponema sp.]
MKKLLLFAIAVLCLSGCVGVSADITVKPDGSGALTLEYRVSESLDGLGKLDGNETRPPIPVSKMDFERSVKRIDGLQLASFSTNIKKNGAAQGAHVVTTVKLRFSTLDALVHFLSGTGQRAVYSQEGGINKLSMVLWEKWEIDPDLSSLAAAVSEDYYFSLRFSVPKGAAQFRIVDAEGRNLNLGVVGVDRVTIPTSALIAEKNGVQMEIIW